MGYYFENSKSNWFTVFCCVKWREDDNNRKYKNKIIN